MENIVDRFIRYAKIETTSDYYSDTTPTTAVQFDLAKQLVKELTEMGLTEIELTEQCYVYATLPANTDRPLPVMGLIAHMDTAPDCSGKNVSPRIVENYDGKAIALNASVSLDPKEFPGLA